MNSLSARRSVDNLVSVGQQAGQTDFAIQEQVLAIFPDAGFAEIARALELQRAAAGRIILEGRGRG
jgi:hypothetical protein